MERIFQPALYSVSRRYANEEIREAQYKLLEAMACSLGYKDQITWETIQNPYIPQGMHDAMQQQKNIQDGQEKLAGVMDLFAEKLSDINIKLVNTTINQKEETANTKTLTDK